MPSLGMTAIWHVLGWRIWNCTATAALPMHQVRSDRAGTALARQHVVEGFWRVAAYQLNVFALT
jgi:hypothetical protein